jgi:signal transduction histidine kinase
MSYLLPASPRVRASPGLTRALAALGVAGVVASAVPLALAIHSVGGHHRDLIAIAGPIIGGAFIATGLLAWARRPENRFGALMVAVGFTYCLSGLIVSTEPWVFITGLVFIAVPYAILAHLLVAFPTARVRTRSERALVYAIYVTATVGWWGCMLLEDTTRLGLPRNPLLVTDARSLFVTLADVRFGIVAALLLAVGVVLVQHWRANSPTHRTALAPVYVAGYLVLALYAVWAVTGILRAPDDAQENLERARVIALAAVPFAFLFGLLRSRVADAAAVSELVASLGEWGARRGRLRDALAEALGDPSLELSFWLPQRRCWVDEGGLPVELPADGGARTCTPIEQDGRPLAMIVHAPSLAHDRDLVRAIGGAASLALENERLDAELRARLQELRASRARIVESADAARRRIERDLHDGAQQQLVALLLSLRVARSRLDSDPETAGRLLDEATTNLEQAIGELRELARGIHPALLSDRGLPPALEALAERLPLPVEIDARLDERLPENVEAAAYFVASEALTNVARYAQAQHAWITVERQDGQLVVEIADDGVGGADPSAGSGLRGLADRLAVLDGELEVASPPGGGTTVRATIPCPGPPGDADPRSPAPRGGQLSEPMRSQR